MYDFPSSPAIDQVANGFKWNGYAWVPTGGGGSVLPSDVNPVMDGAAAPGASALYSRGDHIHPSDTSREPFITIGTAAQYRRGDKTWQTLDKAAVGLANVDNTSDATKPVSTPQQTALNLKADLAGPTFTGDPKAPTPATADNDTSIATTAFVKAQGYVTSSGVTSVSGTAPVVSSGGNTPAISMPAATTSVSGHLTSADWNTFNNKAPLASPTFTGVPAAPTAAPATNTTQLATTAFVTAAVAAGGGGGASPSNANPLMNGVAAPGSSALYSRGDHVHPSDTSRVAKAGDTMTGNLTIAPPAGSPIVTLDPQQAAQQSGFSFAQSGVAKWQVLKQTDDTLLIYDVGAGQIPIYITPNGTTINFTRSLTLPADPTAALQAATKQYADTKLPLAGGTMTGPMTLFGAAHWTYSGTGAGSWYSTSTVTDRFFVGTDTGTDNFRIFSAAIGNVLTINGATGLATVVGNPTAALGIATKQMVDLKANLDSPVFTGTPHAPTPPIVSDTRIVNTAYLETRVGQYVAGYLPLGGGTLSGNLVINNDLYVRRAAGTNGAIYFGTGGHYLVFDGTAFSFSANLNAPNYGTVNCSSVSSSADVIAYAGVIYSYGNLGCSGAILFNNTYGANRWTPDGNLVISTAGYKPGGGAWADSNSDIRTKNVYGSYQRGLTDVIALNPVLYSFKGNDTETPPANLPLPPQLDENGKPVEQEDTRDAPKTAPYPNSLHFHAAEKNTRYAGLIAQEVDAIFPEMVTKRAAFINGEPVPDLHSLDTSPLIYALVNAVKELKTLNDQLTTRVLELESR